MISFLKIWENHSQEILIQSSLVRGWVAIEMATLMLQLEVTNEVLLLSRWEAAKLYEKQLTNLIRSLSMKKCSTQILNITGKTFEPYRVFLRPLRDKLRATHILIKEHLVNKKPLDHKKLLSNTDEILTPLENCKRLTKSKPK